MNVVFTSESKPTGDQQQQTEAKPGADKEGPKISLDIENESIQDVFNYVLRVGGLQANRVGRTIFVGAKLPVEARNVIVRSMRLNQVSAVDAANYLSAQGAESQIPITRIQIQQVGSGLNARDVEIREPDIKAIFAKEGSGTLILSGLSIVTDSRLNSITLIGDPKKVEIATNLLTQLDGRKRQVLVNVKVIDINLLNTNSQNSSFSFGAGKGFFSVDNGTALFNFGDTRPVGQADITAGNEFFLSPPVVPIVVPGAQGFFDFNSDAQFGTGSGFSNIPGVGTIYSRGPFGTSDNPFQPGVTAVTQDGTITLGSPTLYQFSKDFLARVQASISQGTGKILTDPSLVVQEGQTAKVNLTSQVVGNVTSTTTSDGTLTTQTITANIVNAGLELEINVQRIDDNGFVTLTVNPTINSLGPTANLSIGTDRNTIQLLNSRQLSSGQLRLRDGQTLIVSGIIQDSDRVDVRKVPILGDIPILGALFRQTTKQNSRQEVIVLLTPQILDDSDRATYGYGYTPTPEVQKLMNPK
jgi:type IV pilus assembly protein PilQ